MAVPRKESSAPRRKRRAAWIAGLTALILLPVVLSAGLLYTPAGRNWVAAIASQLASSGDIRVRIEGLHGALPGGVRIARIEVADGEGAWLRLDGVRVDWRPRALLDGHLDIAALTVDEGRMLRRPQGGGDDAGGAAPWPSLPVALSVGRFATDSLRLDAPVLGAPASIRIAGEIAMAKAAPWRAALKATTRIGNAEGSIAASASLDTATDSLGLDVRARDPAGGVLARLLGKDAAPAVDLTVGGKGPASDWLGHARLTLGGAAAFTGDIAIAAGRDSIAAELDGTVDAGHWVARLPGPANLLLSAAYTPKTGTVAVTHAALERNGSYLLYEGQIDPAGPTLDGRLSLALAPGDALAALFDPARMASLDAALAVTGPARAPTLSGPLTVRRLGLGDSAVGRLDGRIALSPANGNPSAWAVTLDAEARDITLPNQRLASLVRMPVAVTFAGRIDANAGTVTAHRLRLAGDGWRADAGGSATLPEFAADATVSAAVDDIAQLPGSPAWLRNGSVRLRANLTARNGRAEGDMTVALSTPATAPQAAAWALGTAPTLSARFTAAQDRVALHDISMAGGNVTAGGTLAVDIDGDIDGALHASLADIGRLLGDDPAATGSLTLDARLSGPIDNPSVGILADLSDLTAAGLPRQPASLRLDLAALADHPNGSFLLRYGDAAAEATLRGGVAHDGRVLRLDDLALATEGVTATGSAVLPIAQPSAIQATLSVNASDLRPLARLFGLPLTGSGTARIDLAPGAAAPVLSAQLTARKLHIAEHRVGKIDATATGTLKAISVQAAITGDSPAAPRLDTRFRVARADGTRQVVIERFAGRWRDEALSLPQPAVLTLTDDGQARLPCTTLEAGGGSAILCLTLSDTAIDARLSTAGMPLAATGILATGQPINAILDLSAALTGPLDRPQGRLRANLATQPLAGQRPGGPTLTITADARLDGGSLQAEAALSSSEAALLAGRATLRAPVRLSLVPFALDIAKAGDLTGHLTLDGDLAAINRYIPTEPHQIAGIASADLAFGGSLTVPDIAGRFTLDGGRYENLTTGTLLTGISIETAGDAERIRIVSATASGPQGGSATLAGSVRFADGVPLADLRATLSGLALLRRDDLTATVSGTMSATGPPNALRLEGDLMAEPVEIRLLDGLPAEVATLPIANRDDTEETSGPDTVERSLFDGTLRMRIEFPRRLFVRGRGLDSEWAGEVVVSGPFADTEIDGTIRPVRGQFAFAGKVFVLQQSAIRVSGAGADAVELDIKAVHQARSITATVTITGTPQQPRVSLSSAPPLPRDEILSRILFGRGTGQISALEAVQLAESARQLAGLGSATGGAIDRVRTALGVDVLRFESGEGDDGPSATAGKYVADGLFVGARRSMDPGSAGATVTYELTPQVSVETDVGQNAQGRFGLRYKFDY